MRFPTQRFRGLSRHNLKYWSMQNTWAWDWEPAPLLAEAGLKTQAECMSI